MVVQMPKRRFKHKFGSVAWQKEMMDAIDKKIKTGKKLDAYDKTFIEVQSGILKRQREKEIKKLRSIAG